MNHQQAAAALLLLLSETGPPDPADYIDPGYASAPDYAALAADQREHRKDTRAATAQLRNLHRKPGDFDHVLWAKASRSQTGGRLTLWSSRAEYIPGQDATMETPYAIVATVTEYLRRLNQ